MLNYYYDKYSTSSIALPKVDSLTASLPTGYSLTRASTATYIDPADGLVKSKAIDAARFESNGLLIEAETVNRLTYSNDFTQAVWNKLQVGTGTIPVVVSTNNLAPDGTNTASNITFALGATPATAYSLISRQLTGLTSTTYSKEIWFKSNTGVDQLVLIYDPSGVGHQYTVTNTWQKFYLEVAGAVTTPGIAFGCRGVYDGATYFLGGQANIDILVWESNIHGLPYPTSTIPTTTGVVTRNKDIVSMTKPTSFSDSLGSLYSEVAIDHKTDSTIHWIIDFGNNTGIYVEGTTYKFTDGTNITTIGTATNDGTLDKIAVAFGSSGVNVAINGVAGSAGTFDNDLSSGANFYIGCKADSTLQLGGHINEIIYYYTKFNNGELEAITS